MRAWKESVVKRLTGGLTGLARQRKVTVVTGEAKFTLNKVDGGAKVLEGNAIAAAAYDRSQQRYNDLRAERDAEIRLARALSAEISLRVASGLAGKSS